jgi:hypothetical protein
MESFMIVEKDHAVGGPTSLLYIALHVLVCPASGYCISRTAFLSAFHLDLLITGVCTLQSPHTTDHRHSRKEQSKPAREF